MSTYYSVYAEVKVNDKWYNLNPIYFNEKDLMKVVPIASGQSYFRETYEELEEDCYMWGLPKDLSKELKTVFNHELDEPLDYGFNVKTYGDYYARTVFLVNYGKAVKNRVKENRPTRYRGYALKYSVASFEIGESDSIINWLSVDEYEKLKETEQKEYMYYEWCEPDDWYGKYNDMIKSIDVLLSHFREWASYSINNANFDELTPTADFVRLIVYRA